MPCWYFEKMELNNTPSVKDGVDPAIESKYRREGVRLITDVGATLGLRYDVCSTAAVYFHRFYMFHSFCDFHRFVTGTSCLFLAAKLEENTVTWANLSQAVKNQLTADQYKVFGEEPKDEVMTVETILLETLKFDLVVELPFNLLLKFIKLLKGDTSTIEQLLKMAWSFINVSMCSTLCIQWEPELIAVSILYLSCRLMKFKIVDWVGKPSDYTGKWYQYFVNDINLGIIEDICRQVLGLYTTHKEMPPTVEVSGELSQAQLREPAAKSSELRTGYHEPETFSASVISSAPDYAVTNVIKLPHASLNIESVARKAIMASLQIAPHLSDAAAAAAAAVSSPIQSSNKRQSKNKVDDEVDRISLSSLSSGISIVQSHPARSIRKETLPANERTFGGQPEFISQQCKKYRQPIWLQDDLRQRKSQSSQRDSQQKRKQAIDGNTSEKRQSAESRRRSRSGSRISNKSRDRSRSVDRTGRKSPRRRRSSSPSHDVDAALTKSGSNEILKLLTDIVAAKLLLTPEEFDLVQSLARRDPSKPLSQDEFLSLQSMMRKVSVVEKRKSQSDAAAGSSQAKHTDKQIEKFIQSCSTPYRNASSSQKVAERELFQKIKQSSGVENSAYKPESKSTDEDSSVPVAHNVVPSERETSTAPTLNVPVSSVMSGDWHTSRPLTVENIPNVVQPQPPPHGQYVVEYNVHPPAPTVYQPTVPQFTNAGYVSTVPPPYSYEPSLSIPPPSLYGTVPGYVDCQPAVPSAPFAASGVQIVHPSAPLSHASGALPAPVVTAHLPPQQQILNATLLPPPNTYFNAGLPTQRI